MGVRGPEASSPAGIWISKLSLRACSLLFCLIVIALSAFYASKWTIGPIITMTPPAILAMIWDTAESIVICARSRHHGVPYACVILDLILFIGLGGSSILTAVILSKLSDPGYYISYYRGRAGSEYLRIPLAFGFLATMVHIALFLMAVIEIKQKKSQKATQPQVIYVRTGPNGEVLSSSAPMAQDPREPPPVYSPAELSADIAPEEMPAQSGGCLKKPGRSST